MNGAKRKGIRLFLDAKPNLHVHMMLREYETTEMLERKDCTSFVVHVYGTNYFLILEAEVGGSNQQWS